LFSHKQFDASVPQSKNPARKIFIFIPRNTNDLPPAAHLHTQVWKKGRKPDVLCPLIYPVKGISNIYLL
jgi:hypothetical protein